MPEKFELDPKIAHKIFKQIKIHGKAASEKLVAHEQELAAAQRELATAQAAKKASKVEDLKEELNAERDESAK